MKVLDLQCAYQHIFEAWFGSEADFQDQRMRGMVACPVCGNAAVNKMLCAPRLNLSSDKAHVPDLSDNEAELRNDRSAQALWVELGRRIVAGTVDVGDEFAEEARRMHYGETQPRGIRGHASTAEAQALVEEGIAVMQLPAFLKEPLH